MDGLSDSLAWMPIAVLLSAAICTVLLWILQRSARPAAATRVDQTGSTGTFLIKDGRIVDQSHGRSGVGDVATWTDLRNWLGARFSALPEDLGEASGADGLTVAAKDGAVVAIHATQHGHTVTLDDRLGTCALERHALLMENLQAETVRNVLEQVPAIVFSLDRSAQLTWGNAQFERLAPDTRETFLTAACNPDGKTQLNISVSGPETGETCHYELSLLPEEDQTVIYATDVSRLVESDAIRKDFVQTLTKTFADLSTGLAVFDRDQRLVLFNPALLDLTSLPVEFLAARPHMMEFFDRLRDNHVMPEPKNYATWRGQISDMIKSASHGHFSESWSLPGGLTYKMTGRPHPNGAIAFLIEDITDEMALTRQSRSQLETHQSILDAMTDAIAVVGPDGGLLICNASFADIVGFDPDAHFARTCFSDLIEGWRNHFPGAAIWDELSRGLPCTPIDMLLLDRTGAQVNFRVEPLREGLFMLNLSAPAPAVPLRA